MHKCSGKKCVKILCNKFGFVVARQKGSHIVLRKGSIGTVVPNHKELCIGTLKSILKLAKVDHEDFSKHI